MSKMKETDLLTAQALNWLVLSIISPTRCPEYMLHSYTAPSAPHDTRIKSFADHARLVICRSYET